MVDLGVLNVGVHGFETLTTRYTGCELRSPEEDKTCIYSNIMI